jgi:hypothetical protein
MVKQVGQYVPITSRHIKRYENIDSVVSSVGNDNDSGSKAQSPYEKHADPGQPSEPLGESMVSVTCPNECRDYKYDSVPAEHAIAAPVQQKGGKEFTD